MITMPPEVQAILENTLAVKGEKFVDFVRYVIFSRGQLEIIAEATKVNENILQTVGFISAILASMHKDSLGLSHSEMIEALKIAKTLDNTLATYIKE